MEQCPKCAGRGRVKLTDPGWETHPGLICEVCEGTGDAVRARIQRAYNLGYGAGIEAMRHAYAMAPDADVLREHQRLIWEGDVLP